MRTTVDIDDDILTAARNRARQRRTTLTRVIEEALAAALADRPAGEKPFQLRWTPHDGRLRAGVDLSDRDSLIDAMEGRR